jgi:hypothetical protein
VGDCAGAGAGWGAGCGEFGGVVGEFEIGGRGGGKGRVEEGGAWKVKRERVRDEEGGNEGRSKFC